MKTFAEKFYQKMSKLCKCDIADFVEGFLSAGLTLLFIVAVREILTSGQPSFQMGIIIGAACIAGFIILQIMKEKYPVLKRTKEANP